MFLEDILFSDVKEFFYGPKQIKQYLKIAKNIIHNKRKSIDKDMFFVPALSRSRVKDKVKF